MYLITLVLIFIAEYNGLIRAPLWCKVLLAIPIVARGFTEAVKNWDP